MHPRRSKIDLLTCLLQKSTFNENVGQGRDIIFGILRGHWGKNSAKKYLRRTWGLIIPLPHLQGI